MSGFEHIELHPDPWWWATYREEIVEQLRDADRPINTDEPFDEDGYCEFCGNGRWKPHTPWCIWDELRSGSTERSSS